MESISRGKDGSQVCWLCLSSLALGKLRQDDCLPLKTCLGYRMRPCLRKRWEELGVKEKIPELILSNSRTLIQLKFLDLHSGHQTSI